MKNILKWGLGAITILVMVLVVFWVFVVDVMVKNVIEAKGTEILGAKVELDRADLTLFPSGLTLTRLQATNPEKPMTNAVDIARIAMSLDVLPLLWKKVIVEEMSVEGVRFGTERQSSGAVPRLKQSSKSDHGSSFALPTFEVPDVKKIMEKEDLETLKLIETLEADIRTERDLWKDRLKELPGKEHVKKYKQRVKRIKKSAKGGLEGVIGGVGEIHSLKEEIEQDVLRIEGAQKEFKEKIALLKTRLAQIKTAPQRDIKHLKQKYNLSPEGLANLSQSLFGAQISSWVWQAVAWYQRLKPYLEQEGGDTEVETPSPSDEQDIDFLIRLVKVSLILDAGEVAGTVRNITPAQAVFGKPLTFTFSGKKLKGMSSLTLDGTLDHRQPDRSSDHIQFHANGYQLHDMTLSQDKTWPVMLNNGLVDVKATADLQGKALMAKGTGLLTDLRVSAGSSANPSQLTQSLSAAISGISSLSVNADVMGTIDQYDIELQSDLDDVLQRAAGNMVKDVAAQFDQKLRTAIESKTAEPIKQLKKSLGALGTVGGDLTNRVTQNKGLLKDLLNQGVPKKLLPGGLKLPF